MRADTRHGRPRRPTLFPYRPGPRAAHRAAVLALVAAVAGCAAPADPGAPPGGGATGGAQGPAARAAAPQHLPERPRRHTSRALPRRLPGLGPRTLARLPAHTRQALLVTGTGRNTSSARAVLYTRSAQGWRPGATWPARNARDGWTDDHHADDLRTPIGVFTLTDAGGRRPAPGTRLPYDRSNAFTATGRGFNGESLAGSFDYVIAIDYNRRPGTSPLDWRRPLGAARGGGIWLHVDHDGPTHGCIALSEQHMKELLHLLDPARHPVIVMGDAASLER
ncbi:hypothetical protein GCM10018793_52440 [Streptomyces sulfonofaciens]|uniref:L,D-TPase catalytic domain-containing protein n=1 Tax=Streptomyces sulfonofaciens TaxID=68272 RepID=A0A919GIJ2_9ACTN|nr:L,D-transpeptidase family protein [Streptomyces sulfonofaciens]GHH85234.1 hypothetical protein GCM10018793_52440 [Streptomyces sulfonofaciens]